MHRCLQLAALAAGNVAPNPMVGAVLVHNGVIIGEGYHQEYGKSHAEVNCIFSVPAENCHLISESTLYVSLEPCAHFGKTPPCTDLIIANKIKNVVIACKDSFSLVNGKGIEKLRVAGIHFALGVLEKEAIALNKRFFIFNAQKRPFIILKWAQSSNGKMAGENGERVFISNEFTNRLVHQWRSEEAAIMVGTQTAMKDNPTLTTRLVPGKNPIRIVIDLDLKLPQQLHLFDGQSKTIIFNYHQEKAEGSNLFIKIEQNNNEIGQILSKLYELKIQSLIVEGGAKLLQSFIDSGLWDEARIIANNDLIIENGLSAPELTQMQLFKTNTVLNDTIAYFTNKK